MIEDIDDDTEDIDYSEATVLPGIYAWPTSFHRYFKTIIFVCVSGGWGGFILNFEPKKKKEQPST